MKVGELKEIRDWEIEEETMQSNLDEILAVVSPNAFD